MSERTKPPLRRRNDRRRELVIAEPVLRQMTEHERRVAERSLGRLVAAMLVDEEFVKAESEGQRKVTDGDGE